LTFFSKYKKTAGFKFSLDGIHNTDGTKAYVGVFSLNPPGHFYKDVLKKKSQGMQLNSKIDWGSPATSPMFMDNWFTFKNVNPDDVDDNEGGK